MTIDHMLTFNQHYKEIRDYFNVTNTRRNEFDFERENYSIQKARTKLSNLNKNQFLELSTDVHDELQRRINDNGGEFGAHLRPMDSFHKKRNQAREKLSSLSEKRFHDLLNDIFQEIERRGYDNIELKEMEKLDERNHDKSKLDIDDVITDTSTPLKEHNDDLCKDITEEYPDEAHTEAIDQSENDSNKNDDTIQQTVIIPVKASIDWSSDEEEIDEQEQEKETHLVETPTEDVQAIEDTEDLKKEESKDESEPDLEDSFNLVSLQPQSNIDDDLNLPLNDPVLLNKIETSQSVSSSEYNSSSQSMEEPQDDEDDFDFNKPLTTMVLNKDTEIDTQDETVLPLDNAEGDNISEDIDYLKAENAKLKQHLESLKGQEIKTTTVPTNVGIQFKQYINPAGYVPLNLVKDFHHLVTRLYQIINTEEEITGLNESDIGKKMFTKVFQLSKNLREVMLLSAVLESDNEIILLKGALSHLITSVRYYCSYRAMLPKMTINTAIGDLCFSFCNLIDIVRIKDIDTEEKINEGDMTLSNFNDQTLVETNDSSNILSPNLSSKVKPLRLAEKLQNFESSLSLIEESDPSKSNTSSLNIRSNPSKGLLYDRIDVRSASTSPDKRNEISKVKLSTSESLLEEISNGSPTPKRAMDEVDSSLSVSPEQNRNFMNKLKTDIFGGKLKSLSAK